MEQKKLATYHLGIKKVDEYPALIGAQLKLDTANLVEDFKERKGKLVESSERKLAEYQFMRNIMILAGLRVAGTMDKDLLWKTDREIADLNYDTIAASYPLSHWNAQFSDTMHAIVCDLLNYFFKQFQVKNTLNDRQIEQLAIKLLSSYPMLKVKELVFVLNKALQGGYGETYQNIGIDSVLGWLSQFFEDSANHLEMRMSNHAKKENRGSAPWLLIENQLKQYEADQRAKKAVTDKIWKAEERKREIDNYKESLTDEKAQT